MSEQATDKVLSWIAEDVLGVRPELCVGLRERLRREQPDRRLNDAVLDRHSVRAPLSGIFSGVRSSRRGALVASFVEHAEHMRRDAIRRACLELGRDPWFFERADWPRRALGLDSAGPLRRLALREAARFALRFGSLRLVRALSGGLPRPAGALIGGAAGAAFNAVEHRLTSERLREAHGPGTDGAMALPAGVQPALLWSIEEPSSDDLN